MKRDGILEELYKIIKTATGNNTKDRRRAAGLGSQQNRKKHTPILTQNLSLSAERVSTSTADSTIRLPEPIGKDISATIILLQYAKGFC